MHVDKSRVDAVLEDVHGIRHVVGPVHDVRFEATPLPLNAIAKPQENAAVVVVHAELRRAFTSRPAGATQRNAGPGRGRVRSRRVRPQSPWSARRRTCRGCGRRTAKQASAPTLTGPAPMRCCQCFIRYVLSPLSAARSALCLLRKDNLAVDLALVLAGADDLNGSEATVVRVGNAGKP